MDTSFNLNRIALLIQRYFTERFRSEIIYWSIMTIVFVFFRNQLPVVSVFIITAGIFYAARFFREIHSRTNGINYFMIPATQLEKLTVSILLSIVYYFGMMVIAYTIGNLLGTFLNNLLADIDFLSSPFGFRHSPLQWRLFESSQNSFFSLNILGSQFENAVGGNTSNIWQIFFIFLKTQSIFILGGIYFKHNQTLKTLLALVIIGFVFVIILLTEFKLILATTSFNFHSFLSENYLSLVKTAKAISQVLNCLLLSFLWLISYVRLTEKEV